MDLRDDYYVKCLQYFSLAVVMIMQEKDPWNEMYSAIPILISVGLLLATFIKRRSVPSFDLYELSKGGICLIFAVLCFVRGLEDETDPYRFYHGCWHAGVGTACYFMFQALAKKKGCTHLLPLHSINPKHA